MNEDYTQPPLVDITLPSAFILSYSHLTFLYLSSFVLDLILLRNQIRFNPICVRVFIALFHASLPLIFISPSRLFNVFFVGIPWFFAVHAAYMPPNDLSPARFFKSLLKMTSIPSTAPTKVIRYRGAVNICLGILKLSFMALFIDPLLPQKPIFALYYTWFHPMSLLYTVLYGVKVYCILGVVDIGLGVEQMVTGWEMIQLFDSPVLSTSPRDFWSRRWNRIVRNVLHTQVFSVQDFNNKKQKEPEIQKVENMTGDDSEEQEVFVIVQQSKSTRQQKKPKFKPKVNMFGRGLVTFFVSGLFHEMIIMSTCRKITLENLTFFLLQGFVVAFEVALRRQGLLRKVPQGKTRVFCIMAQLIFMALTGRLFLGPFLRYEFI